MLGNKDVDRIILEKLENRDIANYIGTSMKILMNICNDNYFWTYKIRKDFNVDIKDGNRPTYKALHIHMREYKRLIDEVPTETIYNIQIDKMKNKVNNWIRVNKRMFNYLNKLDFYAPYLISYSKNFNASCKSIMYECFSYILVPKINISEFIFSR